MLSKLKALFKRKQNSTNHCLHDVIDDTTHQCIYCGAHIVMTAKAQRDPITISALSEEERLKKEEEKLELLRFWAYQMQNAAGMGGAACRHQHNPIADSLYHAYMRRYDGSLNTTMFDGMS